MHFLRKAEVWGIRTTTKNWASVAVEVSDAHKVETILTLTATENQDCLGIMKEGVELVPLPPRVRVQSEDGTLIEPSKGARFWVSIGTFDPFHIITEIPKDREHEVLH